MRIKLKQPMPFVQKKDLLEFDVVPKNGFYVLTSDQFKQNLKQSEFYQIMKTQPKKQREEF